MKRILVPTTGPADWQRLLAEPDRQWRDGYSAKELAKRWEKAGGIPAEIAELFSGSGVPAFRNLDPIAAFPEWQTELEGKGEASHSDVFVIARATDGLITITVEGKVAEPFGPTVSEWLDRSTEGKDGNRRDRLAFLCRTLSLGEDAVRCLRYQLLHRTASAVIEAKRFGAPYAAMVVHSFSPSHEWLSDYQEFVRRFGTEAELGRLVELGETSGVRLYTGWARGEADGA